MGSPPPPAADSWLVVSDVDHTLLESPEQTAAVGDCLRRLQGRGIPSLLASSKTFSEMVRLQQQAGLPPQPFLFENGCGLGWPDAAGAYEAVVRGGGVEALRTLLLQLRHQEGLRFTLLEEMPLEEIERLLELPPALARLALERHASLPLVWQHDPPALERLRRCLAPRGLGAVHGGRLVHVGPRFDKGEALTLLLPWLGEGGGPRRLLACGDSENDRALLEAADLALVFHPPGRPPLALSPPPPGRTRLDRTALAGGPAAWLAAVEAALTAAPTLSVASPHSAASPLCATGHPAPGARVPEAPLP